MARVRAVEIGNFRGIEELIWYPAAGITCLIGPGDSGKSSILDAIDLCLGATALDTAAANSETMAASLFPGKYLDDCA